MRAGSDSTAVLGRSVHGNDGSNWGRIVAVDGEGFLLSSGVTCLRSQHGVNWQWGAPSGFESDCEREYNVMLGVGA